MKELLKGWAEGFFGGVGVALGFGFVGFMLSLPFWYHN